MNKEPSSEELQAPLMLLSELLYESAPEISSDQVRDHLATSLPRTKLISQPALAGPILIAHEEHVFELQNGQKGVALTAIIEGDEINQSLLASALEQTWDWPAAGEKVERARHKVVVAEMMSRMFEPRVRVSLFSKMLRQLVKIAIPSAVHCHHAQRILEPARILDTPGIGEAAEPMAAFLNVRLFRIENGDLIMDTRGLAALGLPDLQMHFRTLEPGRVAARLYDAALYVYAQGDCIKDGDTIEGFTPDQRWRCQHEEAIVPPKRLVIDIDPGSPFSAGYRRR